MTPAIQTHELAKGYGRIQALHPTTLAVPRGAVFALVGHNGAGKTTLIKLLMNMLHPSSGSATILDRTTTALTGSDFTRIAYASENQELPDWMTVGQFLSYLKGFYPTWDDTALVQQLELPRLDRKLKASQPRHADEGCAGLHPGLQSLSSSCLTSPSPGWTRWCVMS